MQLFSLIEDDERFGSATTFTLTVVILIFNFGVLLSAGAYIVLEVRNVSLLRMQATGHVPTLSLAPGKHWHIFMSHNWANQVRAHALRCLCIDPPRYCLCLTIDGCLSRVAWGCDTGCGRDD